MKIPSPRLLGFVLCPLLLASGGLSAATWDGNGSPNNSGNWSAPLNWDTDAIPTTNSDVLLGNVASGTRTVTFDSAGLTLKSLTLTQTTAGASNLLSIPFQSTPQTLTVTDAITLGTTAANASVGIAITGPSTGSSIPALTANGGLTVNEGGVLSFAFNATPSGYTGLSGNLTLAGGLVDLQAPSTGGVQVTIGTLSSNIATAGTTTISSGKLRLQNGANGGARLTLAQNLNWTGGTIEFSSPSAGVGAQSITLRGLTNTIGAGAVFQRATNSGSTITPAAPDFTLQIASGNNSGQTLTQTLTSAIALGSLTLTEGNGFNNSTYIHRITSTSAGKEVGRVLMTTPGATNVFQLGSDLISTSTSTSFVAAASNGSNNTRSYRVDLNGFTLDGSAAASWTPNRPTIDGSKTLVWDITSSAGTGRLVAKAFNFSLSEAVTLAGDSLSVGNNVILEANGGAGSANILSGAVAQYSYNAGSVFRYSGTATASNAATLTSGVAIGVLEVTNGALKINQSSLTAAGGAQITSGGTLDLNGANAGTLLLGTGRNFSANGSTLLLSLGDTYDQIQGSGLFSLTNVTLSLTLGSGFDYADSYTLFSGFSPGTLSGVQVTGYDTNAYVAQLGTDGVLSFSVVPEPGMALPILAGLGIVAFAGRRRFRK